jgi:hypothetical protein
MLAGLFLLRFELHFICSQQESQSLRGLFDLPIPLRLL